MPLKYILKKSVATYGPNRGNFVFSAHPVAQDEISFEDLCERVALQFSETTGSEVKAIVSHLIDIMAQELPQGKSIHLGDLGSFRISFVSKQVLREEHFSTDLISRHHLLFSPGSKVRDIPARGRLKDDSSPLAFTYERIEPPKKGSISEDIDRIQGLL